MTWKWGLVGALLSAGCGNERSFLTREEIDSFVQAPTDKVDILFVVDDSVSMEDEQRALARGFGSFAQELSDTKVDFHIGVIPTSHDSGDPSRGILIGDPQVLDRDTPDLAETFRDRALIGTSGSDKEKGLQAAFEATAPHMQITYNLNFLRPEANLLIIFVSDEDDCSDFGTLDADGAAACYARWDELKPVEELVGSLQRTKTDPNQLTVSAIVAFSDRACGDAARAGLRYQKAAEMTGGTSYDICASDWSTILGDLGLSALGILDKFKLSSAAIPDTIEVYIDQVEQPQSATNGWTYDVDNWVVSFHGDSVPARGAFTSIVYEVALYQDEPDEGSAATR